MNTLDREALKANGWGGPNLLRSFPARASYILLGRLQARESQARRRALREAVQHALKQNPQVQIANLNVFDLMLWRNWEASHQIQGASESQEEPVAARTSRKG